MNVYYNVHPIIQAKIDSYCLLHYGATFRHVNYFAQCEVMDLYEQIVLDHITAKKN